MNRLPLGATLPTGWIHALMQRDFQEGYVGHLDRLVPALFADDIYGRDRLTNAVKAKDVGATTGVDNENSAQFLWWNSETQSNWRDGWLAHALLVGGEPGRHAATQYVERILASQDDDGYLGIYAPDLRFRFQGENGELWAQATLFRGLLAYHEATADSRVLEAVVRATRVTMAAWPLPESRPFQQPKSYAGNAHGLMFVDVLDALSDLSGDGSFRDYAVLLYDDYCASTVSEPDIQLKNLLDPTYRFQGHGVHTWEHLRALVIAATHSGRADLQAGLDAYLARLAECLTPSGGPIGDEWIAGRHADADQTGYEYCSILELFDAYALLLRKTGDMSWADRAEHLLYNAGLGARHPQEPSLAYLKTDNSFSMTGVKFHDHAEPDDATQSRYRYSPVHQEAAVCCVPNAGRLFPSLVRSQVLADDRGPLVAFYGPGVTTLDVGGVGVRLEQITSYPDDLHVRLVVTPDRPVRFALRLRIPDWADQVAVERAGAQTSRDGAIAIVDHLWQPGDVVEITFHVDARVNLLSPKGRPRAYISRGPLVYALDLPGQAATTRTWPFGAFREVQVTPPVVLTPEEDLAHWRLPGDIEARVHFEAGRLTVPLVDSRGGGHSGELVPMSRTILRRVVFDLVESP